MNSVVRLAIVTTLLSLLLNAETNSSTETNTTVTNAEQNSTMTKEEKSKKHLEEQIAKEKKIAKEQKFYQGDEYDLSAHEIDKNSLDSIKAIEPEYDFSMDHVYD